MTEKITDYKRNCTLITAKIITGKTDEEILSAARKNGYKNDRGMHDGQWMNTYLALGVSIGPTRYSWDLIPKNEDGFRDSMRVTVRGVMKIIKKGTYLVTVSGHIFVIRDGRLVDPNYGKSPSLSRRVIKVIEVFNPYVPETRGILRLARPNSRKRGTRAWFAYNLMAKILRSGEFTRQQLLDRCRVACGEEPGTICYDATDLAWDLKRGNVVID